MQTRGGVDDVARRHALARAGFRVEAHKGLPGRNPDAQFELLLERELADRERGPNRTLGIVLMRSRSPEQRHDRVADELLDGASVSHELGADALVVGTKKRLDVLRIHRLGARREPDEIAEDDRHDLALTPRCSPRHGWEPTT